MAKRVVGWLLHPEDRDRLLTAIPPAYPEVIAHHVTLKAGVSPDSPLPSEAQGFVVGIADDGAGVQALVLGGRLARDEPTLCTASPSPVAAALPH